MEFTTESEDLAYLRKKAAFASGRQLGKTLANIALIEDAIIVYRIKGRVDSDVLNLMRFGFTIAEAMRMLAREDKYQHTIPASLLVQTFMRKLRDDLDRR